MATGWAATVRYYRRLRRGFPSKKFPEPERNCGQLLARNNSRQQVREGEGESARARFASSLRARQQSLVVVMLQTI